jgi:hypothetical protein
VSWAFARVVAWCGAGWLAVCAIAALVENPVLRFGDAQSEAIAATALAALDAKDLRFATRHGDTPNRPMRQS